MLKEEQDGPERGGRRLTKLTCRLIFILIVDKFKLELLGGEIYERTHLHVKYEGSLSLSSDQSICWKKAKEYEIG